MAHTVAYTEMCVTLLSKALVSAFKYSNIQLCQLEAVSQYVILYMPVNKVDHCNGRLCAVAELNVTVLLILGLLRWTEVTVLLTVSLQHATY